MAALVALDLLAHALDDGDNKDGGKMTPILQSAQ